MNLVILNGASKRSGDPRRGQRSEESRLKGAK